MESNHFWAFFVIALIAGGAITLAISNATMTGYAIQAAPRPVKSWWATVFGRQPIEVSEQVKCVFEGSTTKQNCGSDDGRFSCSGIETCIVNVKGATGEKLTWKSSCGGYAYTTIDGENEYAEFDCRVTADCSDCQNVLNMLNDCSTMTIPNACTGITFTCNDACNKIGKTCTQGFAYYKAYPGSQYFEENRWRLLACSDDIDCMQPIYGELSCMCCQI